MTASSHDVVVVGAGIVGAACALECARRGMRVTVLDRDVIGGGSTAAGMGHIVVMDDSPAQFALTQYSRQLWNELRDDLPAEVEFERSGTIWVAADEEEMEEVRRKHSYYTSRGVNAEIVNSAELAILEPNLRRGLAGGLLVPDDGVLYPPCAASFLIERAKAQGVAIHLGKAVQQIGRGRVRLSDGREISASVVVNATGAWAPELTPGLEIRRRKGHLVITDRYPGFVRHQLVELGYLKSAHSISSDSVAFNVQPRKTGQVLIGSSRQYGAESAEVEAEITAKMLQRAQYYMPGLAQLSAIRAWAGFRPATPDKLPLIGPAPEDPATYIAAGHEGLGITTSLATGRLIADQLTGADSSIPIGPYLPSRVAQEPSHV